MTITDLETLPRAPVAAHKLRDRRAYLTALLVGLVGDSLVVFLALVFCSWLRFNTRLASLGYGARDVHWTSYLAQAAYGTLLFVLLLPHEKLYDLHRIFRLRQIVPLVVRTTSIWLLAFTAFSWLLRPEREISRVYVALSFVVTAAFFILWRTLLSRVVRSKAVSHHVRQRILFVGWSPQAASLTRAVRADDHHPYDIVGQVSPHVHFGAEPPATIQALGTIDEIARVLAEEEIDIVILAELLSSNRETMALAALCEKETVDFKVIPGGFEILLSCLRLETVSGVPVLGVTHLPLDAPLNVIIKQTIDFVGGLVGLILSAPIIAGFGLLAYAEDRGPILYRQRRLGHGGKPFWMYKVRSMKVDAEKDGKVGWTVKDDPRRLRIGAFMRRWNIDELPQFWNVLRGEMSLVGPRPERPELIRVFKEEIPHYNARHTVKPGLTGWAQVNGLRGDTDLSERIQSDLYYVEKWSVLLDFQIMFMTLFKRTNAC